MRILAILDRPETAASTLRTASELADRLGCQDIRLLHPAPADDPAFQSPDEGMPGPEDRARFAHDVSARAETLRQICQDQSRTSGQEGRARWVEITGDIRKIVAREAANAALTVLSRPRPDDPEFVRQAFSGALYDAKAAVVIAPLQHHDTVGARPVIAWHPSSGLEQAIEAAQPLLKQAERVVLIIGENYPGEVAEPDFAEQLRRADIPVSIDRFIISSTNTGEEIRSHALTAGGDLLIMGAYSRPHFIEWLFGGPTQEILAHETLPLLTHH
ncbi:universal stress protein [Acetobacter oeni]|uniref:Universal stress protein UspA n=1 Tax=Acetobacter oeni TaxID=304077 RepID=A0A511XKH0_9PROT|nr:universal stress protein [Acetobacter oeni]MBB3881363.1 nucleotide-binding universal stress UspA family protein [Acetobacter oeni]NHO18231.1 universal stress protein [Acetobacter oeni]GBR11231.1 universal stress protein [Acetobacter oeni LMG 21952]GEN63444.1 universal stress protein UspA [Acetobacter oeni]